MLSCKEAARLISVAQDRRLAVYERIALGFHLCICKWCRRYARQIRLLSAALRAHSDRVAELPGARLDDAARSRISEGLKDL